MYKSFLGTPISIVLLICFQIIQHHLAHVRWCSSTIILNLLRTVLFCIPQNLGHIPWFWLRLHSVIMLPSVNIWPWNSRIHFLYVHLVETRLRTSTPMSVFIIRVHAEPWGFRICWHSVRQNGGCLRLVSVRRENRAVNRLRVKIILMCIHWVGSVSFRRHHRIKFLHLLLLGWLLNCA